MLLHITVHEIGFVAGIALGGVLLGLLLGLGVKGLLGRDRSNRQG